MFWKEGITTTGLPALQHHVRRPQAGGRWRPWSARSTPRVELGLATGSPPACKWLPECFGDVNYTRDPQKNSRKNLAATRPSFHSSFVFLPHSYKMTVNTWQMWGKAVLYQCTHTKQKPAWCYCLASMKTTQGCTYIWKRELLFHSLTLSPLHLLLFRSHSPTIKPPLARSKPCSLQPGKIPIYFKKFSLDKNATHPI